MSDALSNGTKFRCFNIIDDYNRQVLIIEIDYSLKSSRVIRVEITHRLTILLRLELTPIAINPQCQDGQCKRKMVIKGSEKMQFNRKTRQYQGFCLNQQNPIDYIALMILEDHQPHIVLFIRNFYLNS